MFLGFKVSLFLTISGAFDLLLCASSIAGGQFKGLIFSQYSSIFFLHFLRADCVNCSELLSNDIVLDKFMELIITSDAFY